LVGGAMAFALALLWVGRHPSPHYKLRQIIFDAQFEAIVIGKDSAAKSHNLSDEKYKEYQDSIFTSLDKLQASINMPQGCFFKV
jgi:hypothetical protein